MRKKTSLLKLNERFLEFFKDVDGSMSIKRLLAFFFSFLVGLAVITNLFWGLILSPTLTSTLEALIIALVVGITSEKFSKRGLTSVEANDQVMKEEKTAEIKELKK